jgi:tetratricopeptide (TPR) repeat protein
MAFIKNISQNHTLYRWALCTVACLATSGIFLCASAQADTLVLKDSRQLKGKILEETEQSVKIQTTNAGIMTIPRDRIESLTRESQSPEEAKAEEALLHNKPYDALKIYETLWEKTPGNARIEQKIGAVKDMIKDQEDAQYKALFREAQEASKTDQYAKARAKYEEILKKIGSDTLTARHARRGIAVEYLKECAKFKNVIQYNNALQCLKQAVAADNTMAVAHFAYAQMLRDQVNLYTQAIEQMDLGVQEGMKFFATPKSDQDDLQAFEPSTMHLTEAQLADARYDQIDLYFKTGQKQKGVEACQAILENTNLKLPKAKVDRVVGRIGEVFTTFDPTVRLDKQKALEGFDIALKYNPDLVLAYYWKARFAFEDGANAQAIKSFDKALEIAGRTKEVPPRGIQLQRAKALVIEKEYRDAIESLEKAIAATGEDKLAADDRYESLCLLGDLYLQIHADSPEKAQDAFSQAIQAQPETPRALIGRAKVNRLMALNTIEDMEAQTSDDKKAELRDRATQLRTTAIQDVDHILDRNKANYEAVLEKARLYKDSDQTSEAVATFSRLIKELDTVIATTSGTLVRTYKTITAESYLGLGEIEMKANNRPSAQSNFEKSLQVLPDYAKSYKLLGDLSKKINDFNSAVKFYSQAAAADQQYPDYELLTAVAYEEWQKYKEAKTHYELYRKKGGRNPNIQSWINGCEAKDASSQK